MARRLSITDAHVWDSLERCYEEAITIEGRHSSLAEFLTRQPAEEVTAFFTDIVALLERRGIENYHLVLKNVEASSSQQQRDEQRQRDDLRRSSTGGRSSGHGEGRGGMRDRREDHRGRGGGGGNDARDRRDRRDDGREHRYHHQRKKGNNDDYHRRRRREQKEESERREEDRGRGRERHSNSSKRRGRSRSRSCSSRSSLSSSSSSSSCSSLSSSPPPARPSAAPASTSPAQWSIVVYHGGEARKDFSGPLAATSCMSCDLGTSMQTGLTGDGEGGLPAEASLIYEDAHMRYWHDAKGRPLFVVTPQRHVHNLRELTAAEMHRLWSGAVQILTDMGCDPREDLRDMILNAGVDRNHAHLHLKVRVTNRGFERARAKWSQRRNKLVDALKAFARKQDC